MEEVVAKQPLMVDPSYQCIVGSCCYATTIIGAWHCSLSLLQGSGLAFFAFVGARWFYAFALDFFAVLDISNA
jgi:hypothetical protein